MIWLVSYPRSGNTFFRNILYHAYGLDSKAFYLGNEKHSSVDNSVKITKTHHLPEDVPFQPEDIVIYLIRDGRDSVVSVAHQMSNITNPGSSFRQNVYRILFAEDNSLFGGWSRHVKAWKDYAHLTIRFEELTTNPIQEVERIRDFWELPIPDPSKVPTFETQKSGAVKFKGKNATLFFHRGKTGNWKSELTKAQISLVNLVHAKTLKECGFEDPFKYVSKNPIFKLIYLIYRIRFRLTFYLKKYIKPSN